MTPPRPLTRRALLAATAGALTLPAFSRAALSRATAQPGALTLRLRPGTATLAAPGPATPLAVFETGGDAPLRLPRGGTMEAAFVNDLPVAVRLYWRGLDGAPDLVALAATPVAPGSSTRFSLPLAQAGTMLCIAEPVAGLPPAALAMVIEEPGTGAYDRAETLAIEAFRLAPDGRALRPDEPAGAATPLFTVNREGAFETAVRLRERIRFRFINGSQSTVFAIRIPDHDIHVWAIDSRPAEPFLARNSQLILPPGGRVDALIDMTTEPGATTPILLHDGARLHTIGRLKGAAGEPVRATPLPPPAPLPSDGLPAELNLARASRVSLAVAAPPPEAPAFRLRRGQVAVLALTNGGERPAIVQLTGHHGRLLDRLDDGWKPYWLDTVLVPPKATERLAFLAEHAGRFAIAVVTPDGDAPRRTAWYVVDEAQ
jgi:FtsP/CotA-like multicopper oxidase with cupredoxin domain